MDQAATTPNQAAKSVAALAAKIDGRLLMQFLVIFACVVVAIGFVAFINYLKARARFYTALGSSVNQIEASVFFAAAQTQALMLLSKKIWKESGVQMPDSKTFEETLQKMTEDQVEHWLAIIAKSNPVSAADLRKSLEPALKGQDKSLKTALEPTAAAPPIFCGARKYEGLDTSHESGSRGRGSALDR